MLRICRAEDGEEFQVDTSLWEIERSSTLEKFLQDEIGIDQEAILAYLSDGRRLTNENLRDLAGAPDNTIFVFNKYYLDYDLHEVLRELRVQPHYQPPIEDAISSTPPFRPHRLAAAYLQAAHVHSDIVSHTAASVRLQLDALSIASRSLDLNILSLSEAFEPLAQNVGHTLNKQALLLTTLDSDLAAVAAVRIHPEFLSAAARRAIESGDRARTLGDYVSNDKMRQVADVCAKNSEGLRMRFEQAQECMERLSDGAEQVRVTLQTTRFLENAGTSERRAQDASRKVTDIASRLESVTGPALNSDGLLLELKQTDAILRNEVETVTDIKNLSTELCIGALRRISVLNADLVQLPSMMSSIQADIRVKTSFAHIQRLHSMIYAYGATLIEIVRRKEFARFFYQRAQTILEVMAKLTSAERKRQQIYRGEVHGQLPFDAKGMDDTVPAIDFSPSGGRDSEYSLERSDVETFMQMLDEFERSIQVDPRIPVQPLQETRKALEKLIDRMDSIESSFDRVVERTLLSSSRLSLSRRRLTEADEAAFQELADRMVALENEKSERESAIKKEREKYEEEIAQLKAELQMHSESAGEGREHTESLVREVRSLKAQNDFETQSRKILEQRQTELLADVEALRKGQAEALSDATDRAHEADALRFELARSQEEYAEAKQLEAEHSARIAQLLTDQTGTLRNLEEARLRGEDLQMQIEAARAENAEANRALRESSEQKERLLHAQALEHDRIMRDHIAEADGDRAVLEQQFFKARAQLDQNERQLKEARARIDISHADAAGLREELQRTEHELREARHIERVLRNDLSEGRASQSDFEQKIGDRDRLVAQILDVGIAFRDSHTKAFATLQPLSVHPATALKNGTNPSESVVLSPPPRLPISPLREEAAPIDPTDPAAALEILRAYDLDAFSETVVKVGSVVRKWQKQCREYRERAKGKITFRNFAKGDLALFLPTRNSVSKPWAAFNVSFPHYFLNAAGRLAEQLKTREWIVARITSITERIADARDPSSNPYGLGDGIKYYMLEVEDWTRPGAEATKRRKSTSNRLNQDRPPSPSPPERPISPPLADIPQPGTSAAEPLGPTRSPTSHLFPVRTRSNSASAGPSSLSRLLAQATPSESPLEVILATPPLQSRSRTPSPSSRITGPPPPSPTRVAALAHSPNMPSPLRPGSRASGSSSSRLSFSGGRIAPFPRNSSSGTPAIVSKAAPTTALSSEHPVNSPPNSSSVSSGGVIANTPTSDRNADKQSGRRVSRSIRASTPSPTHSASEGMSNILLGRRRTTSEHVFPAAVTNVKANNRQSVHTASPSVGTSATSALANFASTFGMSMSIGRRKKAVAESETVIQNGTGRSGDNADASGSGSDSGSPTNDASGARLSSTPASQLLKKF